MGVGRKKFGRKTLVFWGLLVLIIVTLVGQKENLLRGIPTRSQVRSAVEASGFTDVRVEDPNYALAKANCSKKEIYYAVQAKTLGGKTIYLFVCTDGKSYDVFYQ